MRLKLFFRSQKSGSPSQRLRVLESLSEMTADAGSSLLSQLEEKTGRKGKIPFGLSGQGSPER